MATAAISAIASAAQKRKHASTIVVGVAGGTGSGKTTIATAIRQGVGSRLSCLCHDFYYKDLTHLSLRAKWRVIQLCNNKLMQPSLRDS